LQHLLQHLLLVQLKQHQVDLHQIQADHGLKWSSELESHASSTQLTNVFRPVEQPKPVPPPQISGASLPPPAANASSQAQHVSPPSRVEDETDYIVIPSQVPTDPWASTPAAAPQEGEGWAETVLSSSDNQEVAINQQTFHHAAGSPDLAAAMPQAGADPAGPISLSEDKEEQPVAAQLEAQVEASEAPPGFEKKSSPVVQKAEAPSAANGLMDRVGVQFGSLGLFDQQAPAQPQQPQEESRPAHQDMQERTR